MSYHTPPYSNKNQNLFEDESKTGFKKSEIFKETPSLGAPSLQGINPQEEAKEKEDNKGGFLPIFLFCAGANLLTFGLLQLFFLRTAYCG